MNKVAIIILNYNGADDTISCVESILKHVSYSNYRVFVADNCSPNGCFEKIHNSFKDNPIVVCLQTGANKGFAYGNNFAIKNAMETYKPDYYWILNNDTLLIDDAVTKQCSYFQNNSNIGILGVNLLYFTHPDIVQACAGSTFDNSTMISRHLYNGINKFDIPDTSVIEHELSFVSGASMFVSSDFIADTGLLSEDYFLYYEELDWVHRMNKQKYKLSFCRDAFILHKEGASIGSSSMHRAASAFSVYHICRSRLLFCSKYYPMQRYSVLIRMARYLFSSFFKFQYSVAFSIFKAMLNK